MGCILHTTNIELRPRLVSLGRFFCSILLGYSLLGISPKPFNLFYYSGRFCEKRPNRSDCLPNYNCAIPTCYIRPCLNWCKIGVIHSAAIPSKYRFPRHYSGLVGSLCIFSAFKYNGCTSYRHVHRLTIYYSKPTSGMQEMAVGFLRVGPKKAAGKKPAASKIRRARWSEGLFQHTAPERSCQAAAKGQRWSAERPGQQVQPQRPFIPGRPLRRRKEGPGRPLSAMLLQHIQPVHPGGGQLHQTAPPPGVT